jgi:membrane-bound serine protease (ClpP class)
MSAGYDEDMEMEERLKRFAASTRTPPLPDELADLPWSVQTRRASARWSFPFASGFPGAVGRIATGGARVAVTLAFAAGLLLIVGGLHSRGSNTALVPPASTSHPSGQPAADGPLVVVLPASGTVDGVMADYIAGGIATAESDGAVAVIVQLDTLGGDSESMNRIVKSLHADIPTIVWVGPSGSKAASAGTFITLSANLAYMAPSTNIGAASPVAAGGGDIASAYGNTEALKIQQDAEAEIRSIAQERHPDAVDWAVSTVSQARSYTAGEALQAKAINGLAATLDEVLAQADGQVVTVDSVQVTLHTQGARVVTVDEGLIQKLLVTLHDPNVAFILLVFGILLVAMELFNPSIVGGIVGALLIVLAFYGFGSLPLNVLGLALVALGIAMFVAEPAVPSHGLLTVGGLIAFVIGALFFYGQPGPYLPAAEVALPIIAIMAGAATAFSMLLLRTLLQARRHAVPAGSGLVGTDEVVGMEGRVERDLSPEGTVYVGRESWSARLAGKGTATRGARVRVVGKEGLVLIVEPVE